MTGRRRPRRKKYKAPKGFPEFEDFLRDVLGSLFGAPTQPAVIQVSPIPEDLFRKLIFLCHPDKHDGSEASYEVTRWLIENDPRKKKP